MYLKFIVLNLNFIVKKLTLTHFNTVFGNKIYILPTFPLVFIYNKPQSTFIGQVLLGSSGQSVSQTFLSFDDLGSFGYWSGIL